MKKLLMVLVAAAVLQFAPPASATICAADGTGAAYGPICLYGDCATYGYYYLYYWIDPPPASSKIWRRMWMSNYGWSTCQDVTPARPPLNSSYAGPIEWLATDGSGHFHIRVWAASNYPAFNARAEYANDGDSGGFSWRLVSYVDCDQPTDYRCIH